MNPFFNYLIASPSFLEGVGRIFDFGDTLTMFNYSVSPGQADTSAIRSDWSVVGVDLANALQKFRQQVAEQNREQLAGTK